MTRPYAEVIGDPIAQSKSPLIHNFWLGKLGIDAEYRACHVRAEELADYFARRRNDPVWRGCNVTIPHKLAVLDFVDAVDTEVKAVGAANCIARVDGKLEASNTDLDGVDAALGDSHKRVCIIGAGGAARAAIATANAHRADDFRLLVRDPAKASSELSDLTDLGFALTYYRFDQAEMAMRDVDQVINASPLGMSGKPPMPNVILNALKATATDAGVFDMVYAPLETDLLKAAAEIGRESADGLVMLVEQAKTAFEKFFGCAPPDEHDAELRALPTA